MEIVICLLFFSAVAANAGKNPASIQSYREEKSISSFIFGEPDSECISNGVRGLCTSLSACRKAGGTSIGRCGRGSSCCSITATCTADTECTVRTNGTRVILGTTIGGSFPIRFPRLKGVDHLHLEFLTTGISDPNAAGNCVVERITLAGSPTINGNMLQVCGNLNDQHMYLAYGNSESITMNIRKIARPISSVAIRVSFLYRKYRFVPRDCLQYYTGTEDRIRSFGFPRQLNNLHYRICFAGNGGNEELTILPCEAMPEDTDPQFSIFGVANTASLTFQADPVRGIRCNHDYIQLFGQDRFCDVSIPDAGLQTMTRPFMIDVRFDETENTQPFGFLTTTAAGMGCSPPVDLGQVISRCYLCNEVVPQVMPPRCICTEMSMADLSVNAAGGVFPDLEFCRAYFAENRRDVGNTGFCLRAMRT